MTNTLFFFAPLFIIYEKVIFFQIQDAPSHVIVELFLSRITPSTEYHCQKLGYSPAKFHIVCKFVMLSFSFVLTDLLVECTLEDSSSRAPFHWPHPLWNWNHRISKMLPRYQRSHQGKRLIYNKKPTCHSRRNTTPP